MTQEEKAKRYDEVIERLKDFRFEYRFSGFGDVIEEKFPELAESEGERIRKALLNEFIHLQSKGYKFAGLEGEEIVSWLSSQGKQKLLGFNIGDEITVNGQICKVVAVEQKPAEWSSEQSKTLQTDDVPNESSPDAHLWTRAICFDGEPMESKPCEQKPAWSEEDEKEVAVLEAYIRSKDWSERHIDRALGIVDELVNKVKSLRPQPKQEWSEEDEKMFSQISDILWEGYKNGTGEMPTWDNIREWCLSLKARVQPQPKSDWCEEDIEMIGNIRTIIEKYASSQSAVDVNGDLCEKEYIDADNWLKNLKDKVQPQNGYNPYKRIKPITTV